MRWGKVFVSVVFVLLFFYHLHLWQIKQHIFLLNIRPLIEETIQGVEMEDSYESKNK